MEQDSVADLTSHNRDDELPRDIMEKLRAINTILEDSTRPFGCITNDLLPSHFEKLPLQPLFNLHRTAEYLDKDRLPYLTYGDISSTWLITRDAYSH